ncbi:MAG: PPC domain-containing protein [Bryobacteraceae bacterium]
MTLGTCWLAAVLAAVPVVRAQNAPHLAYVLPAGGQQGTTFQVKTGGQFLPNVSAAYVSGSGVRATVVDYARPMNATQAADLRDRMQALQKQPMTAAVQKEMVDTRVTLLLFNARRLTSPVLAESVTLQITIAPGAAPGKRELRVATPQGLSNPLVFCVGQLPEFTEKESIGVVQPNANQPAQVQISQPPTDMRITLPATVNGRIKPGLPRPQARSGEPFTPGEADRYRFQAHQGQELVIAASARELIPYLADAVPGWFQAVLTLYDANGNELAYDDDYRFHPDPVLHYAVPRDGEYTIEIRDALYRGREDFVYRIAIGELPFVTSAFPLGGRAGAKTKVQLAGWNLPVSKLTMDAKGKAPGIYPLTLQKGKQILNSTVFMADTLPEGFEKEPNNSPSAAQRVKLPIIMNGRIDRPGDWDVFSFQGRAGQAIVAEVYARRLDSPLDSVLKLTDAKGTQLAFNDDYDDPGAGLETHHADSRILTTLPAKGTYYLYLGDAQQKGGPEYAYRLRISAPRPDFDLRVTPSSINVSGGLTVPITVHALRKDGFSGDIALALKGAPKGFTMIGGLLPASQDEVRLTLTVPPQPQPAPLSLSLEGRATIQGREVSRLAVPADDMMQAFAYRHLVPASDLKVAVRRGAMLRVPIKVSSQEPLEIPAGGTARFQVHVPTLPANFAPRVQYELSEPPEGIALRGASPGRDGTEIVLACDAAKAKPGLRGNLIVNISAERVAQAANGAPPANRQRVSLGTLPAVPFEIVARQTQ